MDRDIQFLSMNDIIRSVSKNKRPKVRSILAVVLAVIALSTQQTYAFAQTKQHYFYDSNGNNIGSSMAAGQNTFYYDAQGQDIGSSMRAGKNTYYYDAQGNSVGSSLPAGLNPQE